MKKKTVGREKVMGYRLEAMGKTDNRGFFWTKEIVWRKIKNMIKFVKISRMEKDKNQLSPVAAKSAGGDRLKSEKMLTIMYHIHYH